MIFSCQAEIQELENKIKELKAKDQNEKVKFSFILDVYHDAKIKTWDLNISWEKPNKLSPVEQLFCEKLSRNDRRKLLTFQCAFSNSAVPDMIDFYLLQENHFDSHNNLDDYHYYLIPFLKIKDIFVFPSFNWIEFQESEWGDGKKNSTQMVEKLKQKGINPTLIEKFLEIGGFKDQKKKEDLNSLLDLFYSQRLEEL